MHVRNWRANLLSNELLKDLLHRPQLSRRDKLLLCLAVEANTPKAVKEVKALAQGAGLRAVTRWNVSSILSASKGLAIRTESGWELTRQGQERIANLAGPLVNGSVNTVASSLRTHLSSIEDPMTSSFVEEGIHCFENRLFRSAVVLSWSGGISILQEYILRRCLDNFNAEAKRRDAKWKHAKNRDDLSRMKEYDFLQILEAISILGKGVKRELESCLTLRNTCAHPNSLQISENRVSAHIEILILNVFSKFI